jgi:hypothetical protein
LVVQVHQQFPWADPLLARRPPPRSEADLIILNQLREWLEQAGALRKRGRVLRRTKRGAAMTHDPVLAWQVLTGQVAPDGWDRFVAETVALMLVGRGDPIPVRELLDDIAADAAELGYRTGDSGRLPTSADVSYSFHESWPLLRLLGFGIDHEEPGGGGSRRVSASPSGEATMLAILRAAATGPGKRPW